MKKRFTEEQIIQILKEQEAGERTADVCRRHGVSQPTFYKWKAKFGGMEVSDARKLKNILVICASGFVGATLCGDLHAHGFAVRGAVRSLQSAFSASGVELFSVGNLDAATDWSSALAGVDCVIHCAARAHVMRDIEADALAAYRSVNVDGSRRLAERAAAAGVRRFVYLTEFDQGEWRIDGALGAVFVAGCAGSGGLLRCFQMGGRAGAVGGGSEHGLGGGGAAPAAGVWPGCQGQFGALDEAGALGRALALGLGAQPALVYWGRSSRDGGADVVGVGW